MNLAGKDIHLETEVVPSNIPLLLSKQTMKRASAKMNFDRDTINLFGIEQVMVCTSSGHYAIPIKKHHVYIPDERLKEDNLVLLNDVNDSKDVKAVAKKLHEQFSHPISDKLIKLVKNAGMEDQELFDAIKEVGDRCDTCKRFKRANPRPAVYLPLASEFNDTIAMDLKVYKNNEIYIMHVIDHATRFSAASVIKSKKSAVIIDQLFKHWISIFGCPRRILSDNGGEFANAEFVDMCENLSINFLTTAAEAPWSNGLVEKHNHIIGEAVYKIMEDVSCSLQVALCWAVNAKNSLQNVYGFSPYQLVFGRNPNLPSVLENKLPALEGVTSSELIANHLNALHKAREEFIRLEASEKIRRALKARTRTHSNIKYFSGEEVFFKRDDDKRWRGPGRVIGQDGSKVLIKIPTGLISVHSCRVMLTSQAEENRMHKVEYDPNLTSDSENTNQSKQIRVILPEDELEDDKKSDTEDTQTEEDDNRDLDEIQDPNEPEVLEEIATAQNVNREKEIEDASGVKLQTVKTLPKINQCVQFLTPGNNEWQNVKIIGRAGKAKGVNKFWLNVKNLDNNVESCVDWNNGIEMWRPINQVMMASLKDEKFKEAKQKELLNWTNMSVYKEVEDGGQKYITTRWVYTEKNILGEIVKKARLVCRGFEEQNEGIRTDSPTCSKDSLRVALAIISSKEWDVNSLDIKSAFLQGKDLEREIYVKPPKEANAEGKLWKLSRCVYGIDDSSRYWYFRLKEELIKLGCKCSKLDPAVFTLHQSSELQGILIIHVDDILWSGNEILKLQVIEDIRRTFKISSESSSAFTYIGLELTHDQSGIYLSQDCYISELEEIPIEQSRKSQPNMSLNDAERQALRSLIGKLSWLSTQTRPDISFAVSQLSSNFNKATMKHVNQANKIVRRCHQHKVHMLFPKFDLSKIKVRCYGDASFGKMEDGGSQGGVFVEIVSEGQTAPVAWYSKKIRRVVKSTLAAETLAIAEAVEAGYLISTLLSDIVYEGTQKIELEAVTDNYSLYEAARSTKSNSDRRLRIDLGILREYIAKEDLVLSWVSTSHQLSDVLTKDGVDPSMLLSHISA